MLKPFLSYIVFTRAGVLAAFLLLTGAMAPIVAQSCSTTPTILTYDFTDDHLRGYAANNPGTIISDVQITGLNSGETLSGMSFRPATGQLYGLASDSITTRILTINTTTGVATAVGTPLTATADVFRGVAFNPVVDRLRVIGDAGSNRRYDPTTGALTAADTTLGYVAGDPSAGSTPSVVHIGYDRNAAGATLTTLYGVDYVKDTLVRIGGVDGNPSPNGGQVTTIGPLGFDVTRAGDMVIQGGSGTAYAVMRVAGVSTLFTINLTTGAATSVGPVVGAATVEGIAVAPCTAASGNVSISGRVTTSDGRGLRNASVTLTGPGGTQTVTTSTFGFYQFDSVATGQTYTLTVGSRLFTFTSRTLPLTDNVTNFDFVGS